MTIEELLQLRSLVCESLRRDDSEVMPHDELIKLKDSINLELDIRAIKRLYKTIDSAMPTTDDEDSWNAFYEKSFYISFGNAGATIPVDTTIYQGIRDTLKEYVEHCL